MTDLGLSIIRTPSAFPVAKLQIGGRARAIASEIASLYGLTIEQVQGAAQYRSIAWPRQHVMAALREAGYGERSIGAFLNRDHSTVSHGSRRHLERAAWAEVVLVCAGGLVQYDLFARAA